MSWKPLKIHGGFFLATQLSNNSENMASISAVDDEKSAVPTTNGSADLEHAASLQAADKDIAIAIVGEQRHAINPAAEARVVRKIDLFLVPAMFIGYGLVYYDKVRSPLR
jgi:hypothetical protein